MTLNVNSLLCCQLYCDQTADARITWFRHKALYVSYLRIKFDDKILRESLSNFKYNFGLTYYLSSVTRVYCDKPTAIVSHGFHCNTAKDLSC